MRNLSGAALAALLLLLAACGPPLDQQNKTTNASAGPPPPPATLALLSGNSQIGRVGEPLGDPLSVVVKSGTVFLGGADVRFDIVSGSGTLSSADAVTDELGRASVTLSPTAPGTIKVVATALAFGAQTLFTESALGAPARVVIASGDGQSGAIGATLAKPLVARVEDSLGDPLPGETVAWSIAGEATFSGIPEATTDANGLARAWLTLGTSPGATQVIVSSGGLFATFRATTSVGAASKLAIVSGSGQSATVGATLAPLVVAANDAAGNPVPGVSIAFAVASGDATLSPAQATTDAQGQASATVVLGSTPGAVRVTASATNLSTATFSETSVVGAASTLAAFSGGNQSGPVSTKLSQPLVVVARDSVGNPVPGVNVFFTIASGAGTLAPTSATTGSDGKASTTLTLGSLAGTTTVAASTASLASVPFTATATAPAQPAWSAAGSLANARSSFGAARGADGRIYVAGGAGQTTLEAFDPSSSVAAVVTALATQRSSLAAATARDGQVWFIGGRDASGDLTVVESWDPVAFAWTTQPSLATARSALGAATGADGRVRAIGGTAGGVVTGANEAFDATTSSWIAGASLPTPRSDLAVLATTDGRIWAIGGRAADGSVSSAVEVYTTSTDSWAAIAALPTPRAGLSAALDASGRIVVAGGFDATGIPLDVVETFDPVKRTWTTAAVLPASRALAVACSADGRVLVLGGVGRAGTLASVVANGSTLSLSPAVGPSGSSFTASGASFAPASSVTLSWASAGGQVLATVTTDANGAFSTTLTVPASATSGDTIIVSTDARGNRATAPFTVP